MTEMTPLQEAQVELNPRQWKLYRIMLEHPYGLTIKGICELMPDDYYYNDSIQCHGNHCAKFYKDREIINHSLRVDKAIGSWEDGIWRFAHSNEELKTLAMQDYQSAMRMLGRYQNVMNKAKQDNQGKLLNNDDKPLQVGNKEFHEATLEVKPREEPDTVDIFGNPTFTTLI